jgi:quinol monooxygenase YgiN
MIVIYGGVTVDPIQTATVTEAAKTFQAQCQLEEGCVEYLLSWNAVETNRLQLVEAWESPEALAAHQGQQHVAAWTRLISSAAVDAPEFTKLEAAAVPAS